MVKDDCASVSGNSTVVLLFLELSNRETLFIYQVNATPELDMVEFACLTYQPVVEPFDMSVKLNFKDVGLFNGDGKFS